MKPNCSSFFQIKIHKNVQKHSVIIFFLKVAYNAQQKQNNVAAAGM